MSVRNYEWWQVMRRGEDSRNPLCVAAARRRQKHNRKEDDKKKMRSIRTSSSVRYNRGYALKEKKLLEK